MKITKCLFVLFSILIFTNSILAQNLFFGVTVNPGLSKVTPIESIPFTQDFVSEFTWSGNIGCILEKKLNKKSSIGLEVLWVQLEGFASTEPGLNLAEIKTNQSYFGIPIYYRNSFKRWGVKIGIQTLFLINAKEQIETFDLVNDEFQYTGGYGSNGIKHDSFDIGPKVGIDFLVFENFRLRADYYYGFSDYAATGFIFENNFQQFNLGASFLFGIK